MDAALKRKLLATGTPIEIWFQDEARIGQKNGLVYQWAKTGTRPRQPKDQRYDNAYLFGAICPARDTGAAIVMPYADTHAMQTHLDEISRHVAPGAHAVLLLDQAAWHTTGKLQSPANITMICAIPPGIATRLTSRRPRMENSTPNANSRSTTPTSARAAIRSTSPTNPGVAGPMTMPAMR